MYNIGFIGLGRIGYNLAGNINKIYNTYVWNRTIYKTEQHKNEYNTKVIKNLNDFSKCNIILLCLPTYIEVNNIVNKLIPNLKKNTTLIDCTSSDYNKQKELYNKLKKCNINYFDAPVSGGPEKAKLGNITCMISGDKHKYSELEDIFKSFSKPQFVGEIGTASAIKSINNIMNVSHLCIAAEALQSLENIGVNKEIALKVINESSGRSLMTQERIPKHIIKNNYNYGFSLDLMNKDVNLALKIIQNPIMFSNISLLLQNSLKNYGKNADYTEITKLYFSKNITKK